MATLGAQSSSLQGDTSDLLLKRVYSPLDTAFFETRFLKIVEATHDGVIRCDLSSASLLKPPVYTALSYAWGDSTDARPVEVNGVIFNISINLERALVQLNARGEQLLWIDALCVNQEDKYEKSQQILRMGQIYSTAKKTVAWLGPGDPDSSCAMDVLRSGVTADTTWIGARPLHSVKRLLDCPYFKRVWIIQEVAKAGKVEIWCGKLSMPFETFSSSAAMVLPKLSAGDEVPTLFGTLTYFRVRERRSRFGVARMLLSEALLRSRSSLATDPRDKMYALLGLTLDGAEVIPTPNYIQSPDEAFLQATIGMVVTEGQSSIMLLARGGATAGSQLSWVPNWAALPTMPPWVIQSVLRDRESLDFTSSFDDGVLSVWASHLEFVVPTMEGVWPFSDVPSSSGKPHHTYRLLHGNAETMFILAAAWWAVTSCLRWGSSDEELEKHIPEEKEAAAFALVCALGVIEASGSTYADKRQWITWKLMARYTVEERVIIQDFAKSVVRLRCAGFYFGDLAFIYLGYTPLQDTWLSRLAVRWKTTHDHHPELELRLLTEAILKMSAAAMRLAVSVVVDKEHLRVVHQDTVAWDIIWRLENCPLPVVLRQVTREGQPVQSIMRGGKMEGPKLSKRYHRFVGEVCPQMYAGTGKGLDAKQIPYGASAGESWHAINIV